MPIITSRLGKQIGAFFTNRAYWAVRMDKGWLTELDEHVDIAHGIKRGLQWFDDLVATGDTQRIKELWLFCPPNQISPQGNSARLTITEPGTAFVMVGRQMSLATGERWPTYEIIGAVTDKDTGECDCFIWDFDMRAMFVGRNNVRNFRAWRPGSVSLGTLALDRLGLRL